MKALVLEGGGMRGAYTAGVLEAFDEAGLVFPEIAACSAGACAAASFLAGQTWRNRRIYLDFLDGNKLVSFRRVLRGGSLMDIDYLTDDVTFHLCPLDVDALRGSESLLSIAVTDWQSGATRYLTNREDDLRTAFRATCALPGLYRGEVWYEGRRYIDGGVSDPVPLRRAIDRGGRQLTVVLTSPIEARGEKRRSIPGATRLLSSSPAVRRALSERYLRYREVAALIASPPPGVTVEVVRPSRPLPVKRTTTDRARLEEAVELGVADGRAYAERNELEAKELLSST